MKLITLTLEGVVGCDLLTHNEQLANSANEIARAMKAITSKRTKTDDDHAELARLEFLGGLYLTDDNRVGFPTWNVFRSIQDGAKLNRLGKAVERGLIVQGADVVPVLHDGPTSADAMWNQRCIDQRSVKVGQQKITRTRPRFKNWTITTSFGIDTEVLRMDELVMAAENAGRMVGLGDYRPRFGRYNATIAEA